MAKITSVHRTKILTWKALARQLKKLRSRRKRIVFTNGSFDLVHPGHIKIFTESKKEGDILVVGLNSDRSVRWYKGPLRPLVPQKDRAAVLAGMEAIDFVVIFNQPTPEKLIELVQPDVLVKGGDWKASEIIGSHIAKKVIRIPLATGRSTTSIIDRIVERYGQKETKTKKKRKRSRAKRR